MIKINIGEGRCGFWEYQVEQVGENSLMDVFTGSLDRSWCNYFASPHDSISSAGILLYFPLVAE